MAEMPPEALTDATAAIATELRKMPGQRSDHPQVAENIRALAFDLAAAAVDAAAPLIAAAERERIAKLAEKHQAYTTEGHYWQRDTLRPFADLIRKETPDGT